MSVAVHGTALAVGIDLDRRPYEALNRSAAAGARAGPLNAAHAGWQIRLGCQIRVGLAGGPTSSLQPASTRYDPQLRPRARS